MNRSRVRWFLLLLLAVLSVAARELRAQDSLRVLVDTSRVQVIRLSDGSVVVGRVVEVRGDTAVIRTQTGHATVARSAVRSVRERAASSMRGGEYWPEDPNATRLFFAATGRMLAEGEGYFCDIWVFLLCLTGGLTDRITIGGGMSLFPLIDLAENVFYITPNSQNYVLPGSEGGVISLGVRFFGERMSGDVALVRIMVDNDDVTVPFVGIAVKFR